MEWFRNRIEARLIIEDWRRHHHEIQCHSSLNYLTPQLFVATLSNGSVTMAGVTHSNW